MTKIEEEIKKIELNEIQESIKNNKKIGECYLIDKKEYNLCVRVMNIQQINQIDEFKKEIEKLFV